MHIEELDTPKRMDEVYWKASLQKGVALKSKMQLQFSTHDPINC